ncbi:MAG: DUF4433 domain-containing protein [Chlorobia bacterium]|nr:DUF4433 domain-containing protein [Fimbriimonadaceae bacterium]
MVNAYHITRVENIQAIWNASYLMCDEDVLALMNRPFSFAYQDIKDRRRLTPVPVGPQGTLSDYVPFYFTNRSPMLATVFYRDRENQTADQDQIIHLRIDVERVVAAGLPFAFSDGHGIMAVSKFYDCLDDLGNIDWETVDSRYWHDTIEQPDRKRRKQAEFLIYKRLPLEYIQEIGTRTARIASDVQFALANERIQTPVRHRPEWYYH